MCTIYLETFCEQKVREGWYVQHIHCREYVQELYGGYMNLAI